MCTGDFRRPDKEAARFNGENNHAMPGKKKRHGETLTRCAFSNTLNMRALCVFHILACMPPCPQVPFEDRNDKNEVAEKQGLRTAARVCVHFSSMREKIFQDAFSKSFASIV